MNTWFLFAILSVFAMAGSEFSQKLSMTHKANVSAVTNNFIIWSLQGTGGIVLMFILGERAFEFSNVLFIKLILVGLLYFAGGTFYYTSYKTNSPSVSIILGSISVVVSTCLGIIFFNESTTLLKFIGISLIIISIIILNYKDKFKIDKYNWYAILGGLCWGMAFTLDKSFVLNIAPGSYLMLMSYSVAIVSFLLRGKYIFSEIKTLGGENYSRMASAAFFGVLFNYFTFKSYQYGGNVGVVDAINNSAVFLLIILEIVILGDRKILKRKILASAIVITGIFLLSGV